MFTWNQWTFWKFNNVNLFNYISNSKHIAFFAMSLIFNFGLFSVGRRNLIDTGKKTRCLHFTGVSNIRLQSSAIYLRKRQTKPPTRTIWLYYYSSSFIYSVIAMTSNLIIRCRAIKILISTAQHMPSVGFIYHWWVIMK